MTDSSAPRPNAYASALSTRADTVLAATEACDQLADYYRGDQGRGLLAHMKHSFPDTWERIPRNMTLPVLHRWIDQMATVYQTPPARTLTAADGEPIDEADEAGRAFADLQRGAALWEKMQSFDRAVRLYGSTRS